MKLVLLAAAAAIAVPAIAQTAPSTTADPSAPTSQTGAPTTDPSATQSTDPSAGTATDPSMQQQPTQQPQGADPGMSTQSAPPTDTTGGTMSSGSMAGGSMSTDPNAPDPAGGYQPTTTASSGPAQPGAPVRFQQPPSVDQAYPAPAPLSSYPVCKKGQYDNCMQASGGRRTTRAHSRTRRHR